MTLSTQQKITYKDDVVHVERRFHLINTTLFDSVVKTLLESTIHVKCRDVYQPTETHG